MFYAVGLLLGFIGAVSGISLAFLSQRYWFARAWKFAGRFHRPAWRKGLRGALLGALALLAFAALASVTRNMRGAVSRGSWSSAFLGLWLTSSVFSYLCIKTIASAEWLFPRIPISGEPSSRSTGSSRINSPVVPLFDSRIVGSPAE